MTQLLPPKKEVALALLERSNVDVYLDPRAKGVVVPPQFRKEPRLILKIGLNMPVPIPDLRLDDESMSCTLSFNRAKFFCVVPWMSVFAMVGDDGRGMVWPDDVPQELAVRVVDDRRPASSRDGGREKEGDGAGPPPPSSRGAGSEKIGDKVEKLEKGGARASKSRIQPDAPRDDRREASLSERGGRRPRKKKKEEARPVLVAVPSPPSEKSVARLDKLDDRASSPSQRHAGGAPPAAGSDRLDPRERPAPATTPRPKRELPPYLRVVK